MLKTLTTCFLLILNIGFIQAQNFIRTELSTKLSGPWEIIYGPDGFLWLSEAGGVVSRVDPSTGAKIVVYTAADYFGGAPEEQLQACFKPNILAGTLGLALHPDFSDPSTSFIYFVHSYNSGTTLAPSTKFKIVRLNWDAKAMAVVGKSDIVLDIPSSYDHIGGQLTALKRKGVSHLYLSVGDNGISEENAAACYQPQSLNPNNNAKNPAYKNGKIHRFNMDGSIPADNPIVGNSFYTRGHRNPQGFMYNPTQDILYEIEHGDRTDDEINILEAGKNYGWKDVRGYHTDNNVPNEAEFVKNYVPNPAIPSDALKEAFYAWCNVSTPTDADNLNWCTVAPADGIYYESTSIKEWTNSLLVVTLKNGVDTDQEVYQFRLNADGKTLYPSTPTAPNPKRFFGSDQNLNGRLRDIAISPDGRKIFLINNGGSSTDKITVYSYTAIAPIEDDTYDENYGIFPNPTSNVLHVDTQNMLRSIEVYNIMGQQQVSVQNTKTLDLSPLPKGMYLLKITNYVGKVVFRKAIKR